ncbi:MAG: hypothetical protein ACMVP2_06980 [Imperialibacter sp.]|uniref:hypothetical protein n=1 Tax=Imperialibacter sp. TaxID=2038411 RepID=UPI003A887934
MSNDIVQQRSSSNAIFSFRDQNIVEKAGETSATIFERDIDELMEAERRHNEREDKVFSQPSRRYQQVKKRSGG